MITTILTILSIPSSLYIAYKAWETITGRRELTIWNFTILANHTFMFYFVMMGIPLLGEIILRRYLWAFKKRMLFRVGVFTITYTAGFAMSLSVPFMSP